MFVQNDSSVYWHEPTSGDTGESSEVLFAQMRESLKNSPCEEVLAAFKTRKGLQASEALNMLLLEDVILYVADEEIESLVEEFCCLTGATKVDTVTPCLTTHIVCMRETPMLRGTISSIHAKVTSGATSAKAALTTERSHLDLVTPNWLKECLMQQKQIKTSLFKPEVVRKTTETVMEGLKTTNKENGLQYRAKTNIFGGNTFAILDDSFLQSCETIDFVEDIRRRIIENGGKVVQKNQRANYVV